MSDSEWDEIEIPPLPCPILGGPGSITREPRLPAELEEVSKILGRMKEPVAWFDPDAEKVRRLSWTALTTVNLDRDNRLAEITGPLYLAYRDLVPREHRAFFIDEIVSAAANGHCGPDGLAFLVWLEDEPLLIARAAAAYVDFCGLATGDPMPAAGMLLSDWEDDNPYHRAGIFLGLLVLGCPEILDDLRLIRQEMTHDEVSMICDATIVSPYDTTVDFTVEWLEEVQSEKDHRKFAMLAAAITPRGPEDEENKDEAAAADWHRLTPPGSDDEITDHWFSPIDRRSMGKHLGPRLEALAQQEAGTRVMPAVLAAYGIDSDGEAS